MFATGQLTLVKTNRAATPVALAATWLWAELMDVPGIHISPVDDVTIDCAAAPHSGHALASRVRHLLQEHRFVGWQTAPADEGRPTGQNGDSGESE